MGILKDQKVEGLQRPSGAAQKFRNPYEEAKSGIILTTHQID